MPHRCASNAKTLRRSSTRQLRNTPIDLPHCDSLRVPTPTDTLFGRLGAMDPALHDHIAAIALENKKAALDKAYAQCVVGESFVSREATVGAHWDEPLHTQYALMVEIRGARGGCMVCVLIQCGCMAQSPLTCHVPIAIDACMDSMHDSSPYPTSVCIPLQSCTFRPTAPCIGGKGPGNPLDRP